MQLNHKRSRSVIGQSLYLSALASMLLGTTADASSSTSTTQWSLSGNGNFDVGSNWSSGLVPTSFINAANTTSYTITHSDSISDIVNSFTTDGQFILSGGSLAVNNGLTVSNSTFTISGGLLTASVINLNSGVLDYETSGTDISATLDNGTITTDQISGIPGYAYTRGYLEVGSGETLTLGSGLNVTGADLVMYGNGNIINNTILNSSEGQSWYISTQLTNNATVEASGANSMLELYGPLNNSGTIRAENGGNVILQLSAYTNLGTIQSDGTGSLLTLSGTAVLTPASAEKSLRTSNGGEIDLASTLDNTGQIFDPSSIGAAGSFVLNGGTILGGTIDNSQNLGLISGTLNGVTLQAGDGLNFNFSHLNQGTVLISNAFNYSGDPTFNLSKGGSLTISGGANINGTGGPILDNATLTSDPSPGVPGTAAVYLVTDGSLTLGSGLKIIGGDFNMQGNGNLINEANINSTEKGGLSFKNSLFTNKATVEASGAQGYLVFQFGTLDNQGTIAAMNGGRIFMSEYSYTALGTLQSDGVGSNIFFYGGQIALNPATDRLETSNGGVFYLAASLNNTGQTFDIGAIGPANSFILDSGTIEGGTINNPQDLGSHGGTLSDVTLQAGHGLNLSDSNSSTYISGSFNYSSDPTFNLSNGAGLVFNSSADINGISSMSNSGQGSTTLNNAVVTSDPSPGTPGTSYGSLQAGIDETLTLGSGLTVAGKEIAIGSNGSVINDTTLNSSEGGNWNIAPSTFTNNATVEATGPGSSLSLSGSLNNGGTIQAINGGTVSLSAANYSNLGNVTSNGSGSQVNIAGGQVYLVNGGHLTAINGGTINDNTMTTLSYRSFMNVGSGSSVNLTGNGSPLLIEGGTLMGSGTINGSVNNYYGGTVLPGDAPGTLTLAVTQMPQSGSYTQGDGSTLFENIGGTNDYSLLKVGGAASVAGTVDVNLLNGFSPTVGQQFGFLSYGTLTSQTLSVDSLNPGYSYSIFNNPVDNMLFLHVTASASPAPEPKSLNIVLMTFGFLGMLLLRKRRSLAG